MRLKPRGRVVSLLSWGLLVGGVALLSARADPVQLDAARALPLALLFVLGGVVFGMSHPEGRAWAGAVLLGWVPALAGLVLLARDPGWGAAVTAAAMAAVPAILAAGGAFAGALIVRSRDAG